MEEITPVLLVSTVPGDSSSGGVGSSAPSEQHKSLHLPPDCAMSLRCALAELLQGSGVELKPGHAELLVDALLSPHAALVDELKDEDEEGEGEDVELDDPNGDGTLVGSGNEMENATEESEDLPLGIGDGEVDHTSPALTPADGPARSKPIGIQLVSRLGQSQVYSDYRHAASMTKSLRARLGEDLSDHLRSEAWLDRHPGVADVMDHHPELVDIMQELLKERQSLQEALAHTQEETIRRQQEHVEHAQYLEELSTAQIETARYELAAKQALVLQNVAVEMDPDDIIEKMSKQLQEKELQMNQLLSQQNGLKQELAEKEQQHSERFQQYEESQQKLVHELENLKSQLAEGKVRSLKRRKRYGGTTSRPSSLLLEQLSHLASEKADEAERLRLELLALQQHQQDMTDLELHRPPFARSRATDSLGRSLAGSNRGSALFDYGLGSRTTSHEFDHSLMGSLRRSRSPGQTSHAAGSQQSEDEPVSVVDKFLSSLSPPQQFPSSDPVMLMSLGPSAIASHSQSRRPSSPLLSLSDRRSSQASMTEGDHHQTYQPGGHCLPTTQSVAPLHTHHAYESGSAADSPEMQEITNSRCSSLPEDTPVTKMSAGEVDGVDTTVHVYHPPKWTHQRTATSHTAAGRSQGSKAALTSALLLTPEDCDTATKVYRSRSCPKLEAIAEKYSLESIDAGDGESPIKPAKSLNSVASGLIGLHPDTASDDDQRPKEFRSHSFGGRGESQTAHQEFTAATSRINWLPVSGMSAFLSPSPSSFGSRNASTSPARPISHSRSLSSVNDVQLFNVAVVGPSNSGKTSFVRSFGTSKELASQSPGRKHSPTIGVDFVVCTSTVCGVDVTLKVWDTAGSERFRSLATGYLRRCDGVMLMFDVTDRSSFAKVKFWYDQIMSVCREDVVVLMLGNKLDHVKDKAPEEVVNMTDAIGFAQEINSAMYLEVSATERHGVSESCTIITTAMLGQQWACRRKTPATSKTVEEPVPEEEQSRCCWS